MIHHSTVAKARMAPVIHSAHDLAGANLVHVAPLTTFGFLVAVVSLRVKRVEEAQLAMCQLVLPDLFANKPHMNHARCFEPIGNQMLLCALLGAVCLHAPPLILAHVLDLLNI